MDCNFQIEHQEICHNTAYEIGQSIRPLCTTGTTLTLDLEQVRYIDSSGLSFLFNIHRTLASKQGTLQLLHVNEQVLATLHLTNMNKVFHVIND